MGLGNVGNFKAVSTAASQGLTDTEKSNARANIGAGTSNFSGNYNDLSNKPTIPTKVSQLTNDSGYTTNTGTITGINMNGASKGTSGVVDLGTVITSHQDISGKADKSTTVSNVAWDSTNKKLTKTINGTTSDVVTGATILDGLTKSQITTALGYTPPTSDTNTHRPIQVNGTEILGNNTTALNLKAGSNVSVTNSSGTVTIAATDTTYSDATTSTHGLMSTTDKTKLNGISTGANQKHKKLYTLNANSWQASQSEYGVYTYRLIISDPYFDINEPINMYFADGHDSYDDPFFDNAKYKVYKNIYNGYYGGGSVQDYPEQLTLYYYNPITLAAPSTSINVYIEGIVYDY